ncbi:MAG: HEPN domain-containing protein [Candidatus Aenigmarchaeota archaeon]|nr:HEPN domain-containing protein [Candidatus Aenigmarchaeota archaeon]
MNRVEFLKRKIDRHLLKEQLFKNQDYIKLEKPFLAKSRKNFAVANLLFNISEKDELKKSLNLAYGFETYEWTTIVSYYSMYVSALAALAKLGLKSKSHAATIAVLEYHYVRNGRTLEARHIQKLSKAYSITEELITKLIETKTKRETAQYDATSAISRENAKTALEDAEEFITKIEEALD